MKIILLKDIAKVGKKYETKEISDGYAVNMLIPRGLAVIATADALKRVQVQKARHEGEQKVNEELLAKNLSDLSEKTIGLTEKANEKGHLFASIHIPEIVAAIELQTKLVIPSEYIVLVKPIKELGVHSIEVRSPKKTIKFDLEIKVK